MKKAHGVGGHRGSVGAGPQVGEVALEPGQVTGSGLELAVDALDGAVELDEPVPLDGGELGDHSGSLATCSSIPQSVRRARSAL
jgi:hypothetical protein